MDKLLLEWTASQGKAKVTMGQARYHPLRQGDGSTELKQEEQSRPVTETRVNQQLSDSPPSLSPNKLI